MTIEEAKRRAELYSALAERKTIQVQNSYTDEWRDLDINKIYGFINGFNYRIKSEPKYRPFKSQEECWEEMHKHPDFGWVRDKKSKCYVHISLMRDYTDINSQPYDSAFSNYTFTDGKPFGIKEE